MDARTRGDILRVASGIVILVLVAAGIGPPEFLTGWNADGGKFLLRDLLSGFFFALGPISIGRKSPAGPNRGIGPSPWIDNRTIGSFTALAASTAGLSLRAAGVPFPTPFATPLARLLPAVAATLFALRVPAEVPNAPASGSPRVRTLRRFAPDWIAAVLLLPFAVLPTFSPLGLSLVLGALLHRLSRPGVPLVLAAVAFALLLPDPAAFAFGILAAALLPTAR